MRYRQGRGVVIAETLVVLPVLVLLILAIIQFSVFFSDKLQLHYACYRRARGATYDLEASQVDFGNARAWKNAMPGATTAKELDSVHRLGEEMGDSADTVFVQTTLMYDSPVLARFAFDDPNLLTAKGERYYLRLTASGFAPTVVLSTTKGSSWWDVVKSWFGR